MAKRISQEKILDIVNSYKGGKATKFICDFYNISRVTAYKICKQNGIKLKRWTWLGLRRSPRSNKWRKNLSNSLKGKTGTNIGKKFSEEHKHKISLGNKNKCKSELHKLHMSETMKNKIKTDPEFIKKLRENGIKGYKSRSSISKSGKSFLDGIEKIHGEKIDREFELEGKFFDGKIGKILIEVDGNFWHSTEMQRKNDEYKNKIALRNNYIIYRFDVNTLSEVKQKLFLYQDKINGMIKI